LIVGGPIDLEEAMIPLLGHEGARGTVHIDARTTTLVRETPNSYSKP